MRYFNITLILLVSFIQLTFAQSSDSTSHIILTGHHKVEHIEKSENHTWFNKNYTDYSYDTVALNKIKSLSPEHHIVIVAGTWCPDTHTQLPRFYKIIDDAKMPRDKVKLYFVDKDLKDNEMVSKKYNIRKIPTFILMKNDKEISRIIEQPKESLEKDLVKKIK